jgi:hypothetical protein
VRGEHRQDAQLGSGQGRRPGDGGIALAGQPGPQRLGFAGQGPQGGPAAEHLIDFPHERPGTGNVGEPEVGAGQFDPGLDGQVRDRVGQGRPDPLRVDQVLARGRDVSPVHGGAGLDGAGQDALELGPAQDSACLFGEDLGAAPLPASHR